jgi:hypothetical protein
MSKVVDIIFFIHTEICIILSILLFRNDEEIPIRKSTSNSESYRLMHG